MNYTEKQDILGEVNEDAVVFHGIEDALVGYLERFGMEPIAIYDKSKVIDCLIADGETTVEDAEEWYQYNIIGTWAGDGTPGFLYRFYDEEEQCHCLKKQKNWWTRTVNAITETLKNFGRWWQKGGN